MKRNAMITLATAAAITVMSLVGCGQTDSVEVPEEAVAQAGEIAEDAVEQVSSDVEEALDEAADAAEADGDEIRTPEEELEAMKADLVYMGGLYIKDPENDLMMAIFKNAGVPVAVVQKLGNTYYGEFTTEDGTTEDGREYSKMLIEDKEFGYHFHLEDEDAESFLVDEDGTIYDAYDMDESVAFDMVLDTLK